MLYRYAQHCGSERCSDGNTGARSVFGDGTFGYVNVEVHILKKSFWYLEDFGFGFEIREGCLGGFLHNIANLTGNL